MQTQERIAKRAMVLCALVCRGFIDDDAPNDVEDLWKNLLPWIDRMDARVEVEAHELEALMAPLGSLDMQSRLNLVWVVEGLAVLAWALGRYELHPDTEVAEAQAITQKLLFLSDKARELLHETVISQDEIEALERSCSAILKETNKIAQNPHMFDEEISARNSVIIERVRALRWLLGDGEAYSEVNMQI
jgi:hypothetical protein